MFRKLLVAAIISAAVFAAGSSVYAQSEARYTGYGRYTAPVFELILDNEEKKTFVSEYIVSAISREGTEVIMDLYWFKAGDEKSIIAKKKPSNISEKDGIWILQKSERFIIGSSNIFAEPVALSLGKNKIVLFIKDKAGNTAVKTLELQFSLEKQAIEEVNGDSFNKFVHDMSNTVNLNR